MFSVLHCSHLSYDMSSLRRFVTFTILHTAAVNMSSGSWCQAHVSYSFPLRMCVRVCVCVCVCVLLCVSKYKISFIYLSSL